MPNKNAKFYCGIKSHNLPIARFGQTEDVLRLQVEMDNGGVVHVGHALQDLLHEAGTRPLREHKFVLYDSVK